jgi:phage gp36-like protein
MAYCTRQDLVERLGEDVLKEVSDLDRHDQVDEGRVTRAIEEASAEIDGYAQARYVVPFDPVPRALRTIAVDLAVYRLYSARGFDRSSADESVVDQHRAAVQFLERLASGKVTIGVPTPPKDLGAQVVSSPSVFGRDKLEGF